jgi:heme exporter protein D
MAATGKRRDDKGDPGVEALSMGGYGGYVWSAFGFAVISMGVLLWQSWRAQARRTEELQSLRSTIRGADGERRPRRLVATKPGTEPRSDGLVAPRSSSGT